MPESQPRGFLDHRQLKIIKGVGKTPTDNLSAENDPVVVNLLSGAIKLDGTNGWSPNIPATKSGGVWSDSPITDGRTLLAAPVGNVTETMSITISDGSYLMVNKALDSLNKMILDCRDYWQSIYQVDPVYLAWWAGCGTGLQYALIYNIELKPEYIDSPTPTIRVSMTIEREQYWRIEVPPGGNPKLWTLYVNNQQLGLGSTVLANMDLITQTNDLFSATVSNKNEWQAAGSVGDQNVQLSQNYVSIADTLIPGDAPALLQLSMVNPTQPMQEIFVGLSSKPLSRLNHANELKAQSYSLNAGDGVIGSGLVVKTIGAVNTGLLSNNSNVNYTYISGAVGGGTGAVGTIEWGGDATPILALDLSLLRGTYAVFFRGAITTVAAVSGDTTFTIDFVEREGGASGSTNVLFTLPTANIQPSTVNFYPITYAGTVTFPLLGRDIVSLKGYGRETREDPRGNLYIRLNLFSTVVGARNLQFADLIFMPIDENLNRIVYPTPTGSPSTNFTVMDNTGYLMRGSLEPVARGYYSNEISGGSALELQGDSLMLKPKTTQRLHLMFGFGDPIHYYKTSDTMTVKGNIVPRCSGIRDV